MKLPPYGDILHAEAAQGQLHQNLRVAQASTRRTTIPPGSRANRKLLRARSPLLGTIWVGVELLSTLRTRKLLKLEAGRNRKTLKSAQPRYTAGTRRKRPLKLDPKPLASLVTENGSGSFSASCLAVFRAECHQVVTVLTNAQPIPSFKRGLF